MKVSELLEQVDTLVPNSITIALKLMWMNQVQNQLYRDYPLNDLFYLFNVVANQQVYPFPADCSEDRVRTVMIDGAEYPYLPLIEEEDVPDLVDKFWTISIGQLVIYPKPNKAANGHVLYRPRPTPLTPDNLDAEPTFPMDFIELLVIGCASRIAKASNQLQLAQVFDGDFIRLADAADRKLTKVMPKTTRIVRGWS